MVTIVIFGKESSLEVSCEIMTDVEALLALKFVFKPQPDGT